MCNNECNVGEVERLVEICDVSRVNVEKVVAGLQSRVNMRLQAEGFGRDRVIKIKAGEAYNLFGIGHDLHKKVLCLYLSISELQPSLADEVEVKDVIEIYDNEVIEYFGRVFSPHWDAVVNLEV